MRIAAECKHYKPINDRSIWLIDNAGKPVTVVSVEDDALPVIKVRNEQGAVCGVWWRELDCE